MYEMKLCFNVEEFIFYLQKKVSNIKTHNKLELINDANTQAMSSTEDKAYEIMRELDVNYVLVIFGGLTGYSSDGQCVCVCVCVCVWSFLFRFSWNASYMQTPRHKQVSMDGEDWRQHGSRLAHQGVRLLHSSGRVQVLHQIFIYSPCLSIMSMWA